MPSHFREIGKKPLVATFLTRPIGKGKGNVDLYSTSSRKHLTRSDMDHTVLPANNTISAFTRKRSQAAPPRIIRIANA